MSESKINIPNFSYPFKQIEKEEKYYELFSKIDNGNYLFSKDGFWHGGIHFSDTVLTEVKATQGIRAIADGELVAYRINDKYIQNDDDKNAENAEDKNKGFYSTGFFLLKHYFEYPIGNKLTFFSLYMHTAKLNDYDFSTHKVIGTNRFLRKGTSYNEEDKLEELAENTKITLGEEVGSNRYKVLYVDKTERTDNATIHKSNIKAIEDALSLKTININTPTNTIETLTTPIKIKAGEVIGLVGEYNRSKQINREVLHLEVFTKDDVKSFADTAKETYKKDTSKDKPKPIKIKIQKDKDIYAIKEQSVVKTETPTDTATIKDSTGTKLTNPAPLSNGTKIEIDTSIVILSNRYKLLKIKTDDVSSNNWNIYKDSIGKIKVAENTNTKQSEDKIVLMKDVKTITLDNKKYIYINEDKTQALLYTDCEEIHPITFEWATIVDESSDDDLSIFTNLHKYLLPDVEDYKKEVLKVSPMYEKLFKEIDTSANSQIEAQELEDASKNKGIKKITSKFIVKHSSEWDKIINQPNNIKTILEEHKDNIKNYDRIKSHLENEEKRVEKLAFFDKCNGITDFPSSDKVFHFNPIGLVGEFGSKNLLITKEMLNAICPNSGKNQELLNALNKYCPQYEINTPIRIAHFLAQTAHESSCFSKTLEGTRYRKSVATSFKNYRNSTQVVKDSICPGIKNNSFCDGEKLFNLIHAGKGGNNSTGDGYLYRGRGYIQLTTKNNYELYTQKHNLFNPNDKQDFLTHPDLIATNIDYAVESACLYWRYLGAKNSNTNNFADKGIKENDILKVSANINGWFLPTEPHGLDDRRKKFKNIVKEMRLK